MQFLDHINRGHHLVSPCAHFWLPPAFAARGSIFPDLRPAELQATFSGNPPWVSTPFGDGVTTDNLKYISLGTVRLAVSCTLAIAFRHRYDASTAGAATETGILYSQGTSGISFRYNGTTLELLKSHVASIVSGNRSAIYGSFNTAIFTIGYGATVTVKLYFNGLQIASATTAQAFTGTTRTTFGYDTSGSTDHEYGRHTILGAAMYNGYVMQPDQCWEWHTIAARRFRPLFIAPMQTLGTEGTSGVSEWFPVRFPLIRNPVPGDPFYRLKIAPSLFPPPAGEDWFPMNLKAVRPRAIEPYADPAKRRRPFMFGYTPNPLPPGPGKGTATPFIRRLPLESEERRLLRVHDQISSLANSLIGQGMLRQLSPDEWQIIGGAFVSPTPPTPAHDITQGFVPGSAWLDETLGKLYFCWQNTVGAAVWIGPIG